MKKYKHLSLSQRYQIESLLNVGLSQVEIATQLDVHRSTISRELKRNRPRRGQTANQYLGEHAQRKTDLRHSTKAKQILLTQELKSRIAALMKHQKWSPELIAKRLAKQAEACVSHETIYKWIWVAKHSNHRDHVTYKKLYRDLRHTGRRQKRNNVKDNKGAITGRVGIEQRPDVVKSRSRIGDIEVDLMMGENHK